MIGNEGYLTREEFEEIKDLLKMIIEREGFKYKSCWVELITKEPSLKTDIFNVVFKDVERDKIYFEYLIFYFEVSERGKRGWYVEVSGKFGYALRKEHLKEYESVLDRLGACAETVMKEYFEKISRY